MNKSRLAFILSIIAALLCGAAFVLKWIKNDKLDYPILLAGFFVLSFGAAAYKKKNDRL